MLYLKLNDILKRIDSILHEFRAHIDLSYLFGSVAKGNYRPDSDVDLLVIGESSIREPLHKQLYELSLDYSIVISLVFIKVEDKPTFMKEPLMKEIEQTGRRLQ